MIMCPNLKNPEVAREFNELKEATSEQAAYRIWSLNNGNAIDKAPNGAESKLFRDLLDLFEGDRKLAIQAKARTYSKNFLNWFGDWTGHYDDNLILMYQGRKTYEVDGRKYNYWTIDESEARKNYGPYVRRRLVDTNRFLNRSYFAGRAETNGGSVYQQRKETEEFKQLNAEFKQKYGYENGFDILDNSKEGLKKQEQFFQLLEEKGYLGYREYDALSDENPYVVTFDKYPSINAQDQYDLNQNNISIACDENGEPLVIYYGTDLNHLGFQIKDVGEAYSYHIGSLQQAKNRNNIHKQNTIQAFFVSIKTPIRVDDVVQNDANTFAIWLFDEKYINYEQLRDLQNTISSKGNTEISLKIHQALLQNGYDSVVYNNEFEGRGDSYSVFSPDQIREIPEALTTQKKPYVSPITEAKSFVPQNDILDSSSEESIDDEITWGDAIDSEIERCQELKQFLQNEADVWVNKQMYSWRNDRGIIAGETMTPEEEQAQLDFYKDFYRDRVHEAFDEVLYKLKDVFPIKNNKTGRMRQQFFDRLEHLDPEKAKLMLTIAYNEIIGVKVENNIRPVVHEYIETFHQSDIIQEALRVLDDGRGLSTPRLIRDLVDVITGEITTGNKTRLWNEFWAKFLSDFNRRMKQVFRWIKKKSGGKVEDELGLSYDERKTILNDLTKWFLSNEQLHIEENAQCVYDMSKWKVNGKDIIVREKDAIEAIKRGVLSRLKGIRATTSNQTSETEIDFLESWKDALEAIEGSVDREIGKRIDSGELDPNNAMQIADAKRDVRKDLQQDEISRFLINGLDEIRRLSQELQEMRATEIQFSNFAKLMRMKADIMGFYEIVSSRYIQPYTRNTDNPEFREGGSQYGQIKAIRNAIGSIKTVYDQQLERYADYIVDRIAEDYIDIGDKEMWADNAKKWLRNKIDGGNLSFLETVAGPAYTSTSPIVRIFDMYVREANTAVRQDVLERGKKLNKLYDECEPVIRKLFPGNFMRYFCEMDENGKPTGYFVSKYKIGTFLKRREEIRKKLLKEYKAEVDSETGELQFENEEQRIAFEDAYDLARYNLGEVRKYRPEYYIARRHTLSKDTNALLSQYENQINRLKKGAMVTVEIDGKKVDVFMKNKLSPSARYDYERLQREKDALSNPYEIIFDSAGNITSIKEKEGVAKTRALEIMNWNKWQAENIQRVPNTVKFNAVREKLVEKYGEGSIEIKQFDFDYTTRRATQDWYDTLMHLVGYTSNNALYDELRDKRKALLRAIEYKRGLYVNRYDFDKLNGEALEILRNLEHDLDVAKENVERNTTVGLEEIQRFFDNRTTQLQFTKKGTNIPYLDYEQKRIEELFPGDETKLKELFYDKYFYEDKNGDVYPLSIFSQLSPSLASDVEENVPIGMFSDVDQLSTFVDDRFNQNEDSSFQIDKENKEFVNDRFDEIMKDKKLKAFYEELLNTMDNAWKQLPNIYRINRYQMPQRRDRSSHLITRLGSFKAIMSNLFKVNENDVQFNEEFTTHADGTVVETIPVRWVKTLQDPTMVSTDIIGSVVDFYEMALNFREKQAIAAMGEALKLQTSKTSTGEIETDQSSRLGTYLSMFVYGRMVTGFSENKAMSNTEKVIAKCLYRLRSLAHSKLMKHNWFGVAKNLIDSTSSLLGEIYGGKHFTIDMFVKALGHMGKEILTGAAFSFGKTNTRSWTAKAMQYNGVSETTHELFHNRNESRLRRIAQMTPMIEYTFVDYSFKGCITNMAYDSYKLVTNPSTGKKEFMNMEQAKYAYSKAGAGRNAGLDAFNKSNITLRDAYSDSGYEFELKPEFLDIVRPYNKDLGRRSRKLEQRVASTIQERSGIINGMLNDIDRGKLNQNYIGALVMQMRGWMVCQMADNVKYGHDFARYSSDASEFIDKKSIKAYFNRAYMNSKLGLDLRDPQMVEEDEDYEGMFNLATGTVDNGVWRNLLRAYIHWVKDFQMFKINLRGQNKGNKNITAQEVYQVKKMNAAITAVGVIATLSFILGKSLEGDGDNPQWWKLALYSYMTGAISELTTKLGYVGFAPTVMDLVNSLAIAPSTVFEDFDAPLEVGSDIISLSIAAINNFSGEYDQDPLKPVTSGSYSKLPYGIRGNEKIEKSIGAKDGHTPQYIKNLLELSSITPGISELGIANIIKNMSESGLDTKSNYYISKQFPTKYVVYAAQRSSKPKQQHGLFGVLEDLNIIPEQQPRIKPPKREGTSERRSVRSNTRRSSR